MDEQFRNILKKTIKRVNSGEFEFTLFGKEPKSIPLLPVFYEDIDKGLKCYQYDTLGFFAVRCAFRGIFLSVNYLVAADQNFESKLYGPAINNYYTSAYHILSAFLALNRRVYLESQDYQWEGVEELKFNIVASYSKGHWHLEKRKRGHFTKWNEISLLRLIEYPDSLKQLFAFWFKDWFKEDISVEEYLIRKIKKENLGACFSINDKISELMKRLTDTRHRSVYFSFGSDPRVATDIVNNDAFSTKGIELQANAFKNFTYQFLIENVESLTEFLNSVSIHKGTRDLLHTTILWPWFDQPKRQQVQNMELEKKIRQFIDFFPSSRQKKIR